jgi:hypothetical protein
VPADRSIGRLLSPGGCDQAGLRRRRVAQGLLIGNKIVGQLRGVRR